MILKRQEIIFKMFNLTKKYLKNTEIKALVQNPTRNQLYESRLPPDFIICENNVNILIGYLFTRG